MPVIWLLTSFYYDNDVSSLLPGQSVAKTNKSITRQLVSCALVLFKLQTVQRIIILVSL